MLLARIASAHSTCSDTRQLSERGQWRSEVKAGGKYFVTRNGSSIIAFAIGEKYATPNGIAMIAAHIDALTARLKPISNKKTTAGYLQLGVAPYAGGLNETWWDRDLGIAGRVLVKDSTGKIKTQLVTLGWPSKLPCHRAVLHTDTRSCQNTYPGSSLWGGNAWKSEQGDGDGSCHWS